MRKRKLEPINVGDMGITDGGELFMVVGPTGSHSIDICHKVEFLGGWRGTASLYNEAIRRHKNEFLAYKRRMLYTENK
jgi:hypothetical protein